MGQILTFLMRKQTARGKMDEHCKIKACYLELRCYLAEEVKIV